ncbi:MAG: phosphotransferase [Rhabdochlamydiaceae bacterium]|nr:phosphotransferase [Rhabdochlamydiaceae bacterium]
MSNCFLVILLIIITPLQGISTLPETLPLQPLSGGYAPTKNFLFEESGHCYVLRVKDPDEPSSLRKKEFFALEEASKMGVCPQVHYLSEDFSFAVMDYVFESTLSLTQAKDLTCLISIARGFSKLHKMSKNPFIGESRTALFLNAYHEIKDVSSSTELENAVKRLPKIQKAIMKYEDEFVMIHGDPHPRNLFLTGGQSLLFVDWEDVNWDDPCHDLSFFCLTHDYTEEEEKLFLCHYLSKNPSSEFSQRYFLCKQANLIFLSICCMRMGLNLAQRLGQPLVSDSLLQDWSYYVKIWAENTEHSPQFLYDWGLCALKILKEI